MTVAIKISRQKPILKNRVPLELEQALRTLALEQPAWGQARVVDQKGTGYFFFVSLQYGPITRSRFAA